MTELIDTGERRDALGRKRTPAVRRKELVRAYRSSGLTQAAFARREGVKYPTFAHWVQQARKVALAKPAIKFAEVRVPTITQNAAAAAPGLEVRLPDGMVLRGQRATELAALVRALKT